MPKKGPMLSSIVEKSLVILDFILFGLVGAPPKRCLRLDAVCCYSSISHAGSPTPAMSAEKAQRKAVGGHCSGTWKGPTRCTLVGRWTIEDLVSLEKLLAPKKQPEVHARVTCGSPGGWAPATAGKRAPPVVCVTGCVFTASPAQSPAQVSAATTKSTDRGPQRQKKPTFSFAFSAHPSPHSASPLHISS